ncbi:uracil-DNA glycosylase family protein, partial [Burkholderia pseudomallei]|uniref:uracil-DNA glycosylase family protein n=1 Tax=Burkholderia pseudomallei TaxID=28450 RepID=UPI00351C8898
RVWFGVLVGLGGGGVWGGGGRGAGAAPRVVVALGAIALKAVLDDRHARLQPAMGVVQSAGGRYVIATYHPSFVLRVPDPDARKRAYAAIVEACRIAHELAQRTDGAPRP